VKLDQPKTFEKRNDVAGDCVKDLGLGMPVLVDDMQDTVAKAYNALPNRLFIVKADGTIGYRGQRGPRGFDVAGMTKALERILAAEKKTRAR